MPVVEVGQVVAEIGEVVAHADAEVAECVRCPMMRRRYLAGIFVKEL